MERKPDVIKLQGAAPTYRAILVLGWICLGVVPLILVFLYSIVSFFFQLPDRVLLITVLMSVFCFFYIGIVGVSTQVYLKADEVCIVRFGRTLQSIPVSQLRLICVVGNELENVLCLSTYDIEGLAQLREKKLKKSALSRYELPFRKRNANWEELFAREHLNWLCWRLVNAPLDKKLIWIKTDQCSAVAVRTLYPQITYRNYMKPMIESDTVNCIPGYYGYTASLEKDGIRILKKKTTVWDMTAQEIRTLVRVDRMVARNRHERAYEVWLVVSSLDADALALRSGRIPAGMEQLPVYKELQIVTACYKMSIFWKLKGSSCCFLRYSKKREQELRELYPHAQWVDLSGFLEEDSEGVISQ